MHYRVLRDLGNSDLPVGSRFDGETFDPRRLQRLIEQGRIAPIEDPNAQIAQLQQDIDDLRAENARLTAALEAATTPDGDPAQPDGPPDLGKLKADELKAMAAERGIAGAASMTKAELVAALSQPAQEGAPDA